MDGEPVSRFTDLSTNDHASPQAGGPPWPKIGQVGVGDVSRKCQLTTYDPNNCPEGETPHHLVGDAQFHPAGSDEFYHGLGGGMTAQEFHAAGLCICLQGTDKINTIPDEQVRELGLDPEILSIDRFGRRRINQNVLNATRRNAGRTASMFPGWAGASPYDMTRGEHGRFHEQYDNIVESSGASKEAPYTNTVTFGECRDVAASLCNRFFGCDEEDIKRQLNEHYTSLGVPETTVLRSGIKSTRNRNLQPTANQVRNIMGAR
jgi:hypothetical protein